MPAFRGKSKASVAAAIRLVFFHMEKRGFIMIGSIFPACQFFQPRGAGHPPAGDLPCTGGGDEDSKSHVEMGCRMRASYGRNRMVRSGPTGVALVRLVAGRCQV